MFKSQAQRAKFHSDPKLKKYAKEFEKATPKGKKLPAYAKGGKHGDKTLTQKLGHAFSKMKYGKD